MSILIKGMKMPTSCGDCKAFVCYRQWAGDRGDCFCGITKSDCKAGAQNADCPLVPVPGHHGRLIDADALEALFWDGQCYFTENIKYKIKNIETIFPAEEGE